MKKTISTIAITLIGALTYGQSNLLKPTPDTAKSYKADPNRAYQIALTIDQLNVLLQTSQAGFVPYLKGIKLPMDKLDNAQAYHTGIINQVVTQYRQQFVGDSLKHVADNIKKQNR